MEADQGMERALDFTPLRLREWHRAFACRVLPEGGKDYIALYTCWDFRRESTAMARLECANRINTDYLFVRACIGEEGGLCLGQNIALLNGVSGKYVAMALRTYLAARREIAREHAGVLAQ